MRPAIVPRDLREGVFRGSLAVRAGLPTRRQLDGPSWRRLFHDAHVHADVAVEYDGLWHAEDGQFAEDRRRLDRFREAGWTVVFVTAADLHRPLEVIARIAAALAA